jgi:tripartite-type tricarboxylate transporter receptor subunit TctC
MKRSWCCLLLITSGFVLSAAGGIAHAAAFEPTKPIEAVVHTGPGGGSDIFARAIAELMQKEKIIAQRLQVVNKSGGGSAVGCPIPPRKRRHAHDRFFTGVGLPTVDYDGAKTTIADLTPIVLSGFGARCVCRKGGLSPTRP